MSIKHDLLVRIIEPNNIMEKKNLVFKEIENKLNQMKLRNSLNFEIFLGGSMAKGTDIKGSDLDIFLLFSEPFEPISVIKKLKSEFPDSKEEYSEHPYIILEFEDFSVDIVPAYKVVSGSELLTSVDRTPLHVEFVKNKFNEEMKNEARIMKQFLKGLGIYGAESSVQGFSGYVSELLIYTYKKFEKVIENGARWTIPYSINGNLNDFKDANLVLIDPVDSQRNAAANVSKENLATFILACKLFKWENYEEFFFPSYKTYSLPKFGIVISLPCKVCNSEVLIPNMRRAANIIRNELENRGFRIQYHSIFLKDKGYIVIIPENEEVNDSVLHMGPPVTNENIFDFVDKWGEGTEFGPPFIIGDKIYIIKKRKNVKLMDEVKKSLSKIKLANDFQKEKIEILNINDDEVPMEIKNNFIKPSLGNWVSSKRNVK